MSLITLRDRALFQELGKYGLLTTSQVARRVFPGVQISTVLRRLRALAHLVVVAPPGFHAYVVPPDAVSVALLPLQIVKEGEADIVGDGIALTVTVLVVTPEHPFVVPVNV